MGINLFKRLFVMRHAKSSWNHSGLTDHERPLNARGLRDTPRMAEFMDSQKTCPTLLLSSSAVRAKKTAALIQANLETPPEWTVIKDFYLAPAHVYIQTLCRIPDNHSNTMIIGHNPGIEDLVERLSGHHHRMPNAAIAVFDLRIESWAMLERTSEPFIFLGVWRPKEIHPT